jgi:Questin oxidase-like
MAPASQANARRAASGRRDLEQLLIEAREFSAEFHPFMANHMPMMLVALKRLGATDERLADWFAIYRDVSRLVPMPPAVRPIERAHWADALGDRRREGDYRAFFSQEVARLGIGEACATYLPTLVPGIAASAFHAFMRLAYGYLRGDAAEVGTALGFWAATYLPLCPTTGAAPTTDDPAEVLVRLKPVKSFYDVEVEIDLLWHFMRAMAKKPEFSGVVDELRIGPETHYRIAAASLVLFAATMDFCALHALTGTHWLRILRPVLPDPDLALRYFWQGIAALYPKIGFPDLPSADTVDAWRQIPTPDWPEIMAAAVLCDDEHDISLTFSAHEEWKLYGDPLYKLVAARRVRLIA